MSLLDAFAEHFLGEYSNLPTGRYVNLVLVRKTESETIFRTEGTGEPLTRETVPLGRVNGQSESRIVMTKRKQVAVERRTGREMLRRYGLLAHGEKKCLLNTNNPCERCIDCWTYGYAVGGGGAQRSRIITEDAFTILPARMVTDTRTINALFDNSTMRNPETGEASHALASSEYVVPETHFADIQVLKDMGRDEFFYVLANVLRSTRYGAVSTKLGRMKNILVDVILSDAEVFSTLELTQATYDRLRNGGEPEHPLRDDAVIAAMKASVGELLGDHIGSYRRFSDDEITELTRELSDLIQDPEPFLKRLTAWYPVARTD